jgi:hypothetical protein
MTLCLEDVTDGPTLRIRVVIEKLIAAQLVEKFPAVYGTRVFKRTYLVLSINCHGLSSSNTGKSQIVRPVNAGVQLSADHVFTRPIVCDTVRTKLPHSGIVLMERRQGDD